MNRLVRGCLVFIGVFALSGIGLFLLLAEGPLRLRLFEPSEVDGGALLAAVTAAFCLAASVGYAMSIPDATQDLRLLREAEEGREVTRGGRGAFVGTIESDESIRTPLSGEAAVAYSYSISQWQSSSLGSGSTLDMYRGSALVPSRIVTPGGSYRLLTFPSLNVPPRAAERPRQINNFQEYASATTFEPPLQAGVAQPRRDHESKESHRYDQMRYADPIDWQKAQLAEHSVRRGDRVVVFGRRSDAGIVAESLYPESEARSQLGAHVRKLRTGVIVFALLAVAIVAGFSVFRSRNRDAASGRTDSVIHEACAAASCRTGATG